MNAMLAALIVALAAFDENAVPESVVEAPVAESSAEPESVSTDETSSDSVAQSASEADEKKRRKNVDIALVLIGGIGILGVFLIAFALLYGRRLRRRVQAGRTGSKLRDELWYLKSKPTAPSPEETDV